MTSENEKPACLDAPSACLHLRGADRCIPQIGPGRPAGGRGRDHRRKPLLPFEQSNVPVFSVDSYKAVSNHAARK